jgi:glycosyltransferase involved in cell wall biosynthesis
MLRTYRKLLRNSPILQDLLGIVVYAYRKRIMDKASFISGDPAHNTGVTPSRQLLIDVSGIAVRDDHTGVHRVVHNLLRELLKMPPSGFTVRPIYIDASGQFRYALKFAHKLETGEALQCTEPQLSVGPNDIYFTADLFYPYPFGVLDAYRKQGLRVVFTVHDIIPLRFPQYFMKFSTRALSDWLHGVAQHADTIVCVSRAGADELHEWICTQRMRHAPIGFFHHGADLENTQIDESAIPDKREVLRACADRTTFLMVGTMLRYKGYEQAIGAFESLWHSGIDCNLIIVGKEGWRANRLADRLRRHPENGHRLFWLEQASDRLLIDLYKSASCLIAASNAEGFGIPLIEAARNRLPIIAREIPVFQEIAGQHAFYFHGEAPDALSDAIERWIVLKRTDQVPTPDSLPWQTWKQSAEQLMDVILNQRWYLPPGEGTTSSHPSGTGRPPVLETQLQTVIHREPQSSTQRTNLLPALRALRPCPPCHWRA